MLSLFSLSSPSSLLSSRGTDKALDEFLDQQITNQAKWRKEVKATKADVDYGYAFLQWCDALSLVRCMDQVPPEGRRLEVSVGPDDDY